MPLQRFGLPPRYEARLQAELESINYSLTRPGRLADAVIRLSDHYLGNPEARSPLSENWAKAAYLAYYFPLNYVRARSAAEYGRRLHFFAGLERLVDFGSGLGSAAFALKEAAPFSKGVYAIDVSRDALEMQFRLAGEDYPPPAFERHAGADATPPSTLAASTLVCFSYALTELVQLPRWALEKEALFILEPSTRDDGRRLQQLRGELIEAGFSAWAPCTHQDACPLLVQSDRDWCHARVKFDQRPWWAKLEALLPIKNRTVSYSYLLARKTPPPGDIKGLARTVGDCRPEKGKSRIAICRGPAREFLAWFPKRMDEDLTLDRGDLVQLADGLEIRGEQSGSREIRLSTKKQMSVIS